MIGFAVLLAACALRVLAPGPSGIAYGIGAFNSNGEAIYFAATSARGATFTYTAGPTTGMMMGGSYLTCAFYHGPDMPGAHTHAHADDERAYLKALP